MGQEGAVGGQVVPKMDVNDRRQLNIDNALVFPLTVPFCVSEWEGILWPTLSEGYFIYNFLESFNSHVERFPLRDTFYASNVVLSFPSDSM